MYIDPTDPRMQSAVATWSREMQRRRDAPASVPRIPIGRNANSSLLSAICPHADYRGCWSRALAARYPVIDLFGRGSLKDPSLTAADYARRQLPKCEAVPEVQSGGGGDSGAALSLDSDESFVAAALDGSGARITPSPPQAAKLRAQLEAASLEARRRISGLSCASPSRELNFEAGLLIATRPSSGVAPRRVALPLPRPIRMERTASRRR